MNVQRITFDWQGDTLGDADAAAEAISLVLGAWRMNGQVCGREWPIAPTAGGWSCDVMCPEQDSLDARHDRRHAAQAREGLQAAGLAMAVRSLGVDANSAPACDCAAPHAYALFTTFLSLESPVSCLDCFRHVALHRFQPLSGDEHGDVIRWQSDWQSCDSLQMNGAVLERAATREISNVASALSKMGRGIGESLSASSTRPFYYYLYRSGGRGMSAEKARACPGCGGAWALRERLHDLFDFKCDHCRLLSNISYSLR